MRWVIALILFVSLTSCGPTPIFSEEKEVSPAGWSSAQTLNYSVNIQDVSNLYELQLIVDHSTDYRYQNIYFQIKTGFPDRETRGEKLSVDLATKSGQWLGDCTASSCETEVVLLEKFKFPTAGNYTFDISQYTRQEQLAGVNSLELRLFEKTSSK